MGSRVTLISKFINCDSCRSKLTDFFQNDHHGINDIHVVNAGTFAFSVKGTWELQGVFELQEVFQKAVKETSFCCPILFTGIYEFSELFCIRITKEGKAELNTDVTIDPEAWF